MPGMRPDPFPCCGRTRPVQDKFRLSQTRDTDSFIYLSSDCLQDSRYIYASKKETFDSNRKNFKQRIFNPLFAFSHQLGHSSYPNIKLKEI